MNERIDALIEQANEIDYETWDPYNQVTVQHYYFSKEKFAELIVAECIEIAQDRANFPGFPPNDVNDIIDEIREHFGVEE